MSRLGRYIIVLHSLEVSLFYNFWVFCHFDYLLIIFFSQSIATMWDAETFPWLVSIGFMEQDNGAETPRLLCSGAAVSKFVVMAPAHCISGVQKSRVVILSNHHR